MTMERPSPGVNIPVEELCCGIDNENGVNVLASEWKSGAKPV